jgi:hypothetical protein
MEMFSWLITLLIFIGFIWALTASPKFARLVKILAIILWGLGTVGLVLGVTLFVYIPTGHYGRAILTLAAGSVIIYPWWKIGYPLLREEFGGPTVDL